MRPWPRARRRWTPSRAAPLRQLSISIPASSTRSSAPRAQANGGVYQFAVPRRDPVTDAMEHRSFRRGLRVSQRRSTSNRRGGGKAAITGDFVLIGEEVNPVIKALRTNGIEVTAIHSHMLTEQPRLFFMHFWANDDAVKLAKGLREVLDNTASASR